jgi:glycosyltransferase involved in cell wall biosynthesis
MKKNIIWLASWYPDKLDRYAGDFVERHAEAVALTDHIEVLHVVKSRKEPYHKKNTEEIKIYPEGFRATTIYYNSPRKKMKFLETFISNLLYLRIHMRYIRKYMRENGKPDGIHVHIAMRAGLAAVLIKWIYGIPFIVTEHWSGLCPDARPNFNEASWLYKFLWKIILKNAKGNTAVSKFLSDIIKDKFSLNNVYVVPNVVNPATFYPCGLKHRSIQFIHISSLSYQKNPEQLLEAVGLLKNEIPDLKLLIFGRADKSLIDLARSLGVEDHVEFKGACDQTILRQHLQESMALILYSRYETFGCVIIEANACGIPVIVSDIPVFHENVKQDITGLFVPSNSPRQLAAAMQDIATQKKAFDEKSIVDNALQNYNLERIAKQFHEIYELNF